MWCSVQQDSAKYNVANHRFTTPVVFRLAVDVTANKPTHAHVLATSVTMARATILVCICLVFSLFNVTNGIATHVQNRCLRPVLRPQRFPPRFPLGTRARAATRATPLLLDLFKLHNLKEGMVNLQ